MLTGCFTAMVTPFSGDAVDREGLDKLVAYQVAGGITGILAVGTTGESPSLSWEEHNAVIEAVAEGVKGKRVCIAGTGSNNTKEALAATSHAAGLGVEAVLLVDPYYNGPSSLEIRREYIEPVARAFPDTEIISYVIPGRTGTQLLPEDLALLNERCPNVNTVKEATGNIENMRRTRTCCGPDFTLLSGDDAMTFPMMTDSAVAGGGVISVLSNIVPGAVVRMVSLLADKKIDEARRLNDALMPLFGLVNVKTTEKTPHGEVVCRARNPLAAKTLMAILGMPAGGCRRPIGRLTRNGLDKVLDAARTVWRNNPEILKPVAEFFDVDVEERLERRDAWDGLCYPDY